MRRVLSVVLLFALGCGFGTSPSTSLQSGAVEEAVSVVKNPSLATARHAPPTTSPNTSVSGRYVVKLKGGLHGRARVENGKLATGESGLDEKLGRAGMRKARALGRTDAEVYAVDADASLESLAGDENVEWIEPVQTWTLSGYSDPYYKYQWNMAGLDLEAVHARTQGAGVIVAVVDSGVTVGNDGPGNVLQGYDVLDGDTDASDTAAASQSPDGSHGTHVAGTIAQLTNNGVGVVGIAPQAKILPVRVGDYRGVTSEHIAEGITWAVDHGANVINISIGGSTPSRVVEEACQYAYDHGVVVVAATGNDGYDGKISYPAAYPTVIAVGAHDGYRKETTYSNHGVQLALLAPGGDTQGDANHDGQPDGILQGTITSKGWGYAMMEGTSMASPHVTGAAALLIAAGIRGPDAVKSALVGGAKVEGGNRILDIEGALAYTGPVTKMSTGSGTATAEEPTTPTRPTRGDHTGPPANPRAGMAPGARGAGRPGMRPGGRAGGPTHLGH